MTKERAQFDSSGRRHSLVAGNSSGIRASSAANFSEGQYYPSSNSQSRTSHFSPRQQDCLINTSYSNRHFPHSNSSVQRYFPSGSTSSTSQRNDHDASTSSQARYTLPNSSLQQFHPSSSAPARSNYNNPPAAQNYHPSNDTSRSIRSFPRNFIHQQSTHSQRNFSRSISNSFLLNSSERNRPVRSSFRNYDPFLQSRRRTPLSVAKGIKELSLVTKTELPKAEEMKEWDEVRCPVCMEHPHNAVLLICSSHDKGCRPFMCDTSYRHSYCLDQFCKGIREKISSPFFKVKCPLCRGNVRAVKVIEDARKYMNSKVRNCSTDTCGFSGAYEELRKHARSEHPDSRPSEVDPERQRDWQRMEELQGLDDLLSIIHPDMDNEGIGFFDNVFHELSSIGRGLSPFPEDDLLAELDLLGDLDNEIRTMEHWLRDLQSHFLPDDEWSVSDLELPR